MLPTIIFRCANTYNFPKMSAIIISDADPNNKTIVIIPLGGQKGRLGLIRWLNPCSIKDNLKLRSQICL